MKNLLEQKTSRPILGTFKRERNGDVKIPITDSFGNSYTSKASAMIEGLNGMFKISDNQLIIPNSVLPSYKWANKVSVIDNSLKESNKVSINLPLKWENLSISNQEIDSLTGDIKLKIPGWSAIKKEVNGIESDLIYSNGFVTIFRNDVPKNMTFNLVGYSSEGQGSLVTSYQLKQTSMPKINTVTAIDKDKISLEVVSNDAGTKYPENTEIWLGSSVTPILTNSSSTIELSMTTYEELVNQSDIKIKGQQSNNLVSEENNVLISSLPTMSNGYFDGQDLPLKITNSSGGNYPTGTKVFLLGVSSKYYDVVGDSIKIPKNDLPNVGVQNQQYYVVEPGKLANKGVLLYLPANQTSITIAKSVRDSKTGNVTIEGTVGTKGSSIVPTGTITLQDISTVTLLDSIFYFNIDNENLPDNSGEKLSVNYGGDSNNLASSIEIDKPIKWFGVVLDYQQRDTSNDDAIFYVTQNSLGVKKFVGSHLTLKNSATGKQYDIDSDGRVQIPNNDLPDKDNLNWNVQVYDGTEAISLETSLDVVAKQMKTATPKLGKISKNQSGMWQVQLLNPENQPYPINTKITLGSLTPRDTDADGYILLTKSEVSKVTQNSTVEITAKDPSQGLISDQGIIQVTSGDYSIKLSQNDEGVIVTVSNQDGTLIPKGSELFIDGFNHLYVFDGSGEVIIPFQEIDSGEKFSIKGIILKEESKMISKIKNGPFDVNKLETASPQFEDLSVEADQEVLLTVTKKSNGTEYKKGSMVYFNELKQSFTTDGNSQISIPKNLLDDARKDYLVSIQESQYMLKSQEVFVSLPGKKAITSEPFISKGIQNPSTGYVEYIINKVDNSFFSSGSKVEIPELGYSGILSNDGKLVLANELLPKTLLTGQIIVTEDGKFPSKPGTVELFAKVLSTAKPKVKVEQLSNGDVKLTITKPDGALYPQGTTVKLGEYSLNQELALDGVIILKNTDLKSEEVEESVTVMEKGSFESEKGPVKVPAKKVSTATPKVKVEQLSNGDVKLTITKSDGTLYPQGTTVKLGEYSLNQELALDGIITLTNTDLKSEEVEESVTVMEKGSFESEKGPVKVPAKKVSTATPKVKVEQLSNGDVKLTVTKSDGTLYPQGTMVKLGEYSLNQELATDGIITLKNTDLKSEVIKETVTVTEKNSFDSIGEPVLIAKKMLETVMPNPIIDVELSGDVVMTIQKSDGSDYAQGTKVQLPGIVDTYTLGSNGFTRMLTVVTTNELKIANSELPVKAVTGELIVTEPGSLPVVYANFTTPAQKQTTETPILLVTQDDETGKVIITVTKADGSQYEAGTEIYLSNNNNPLILNASGVIEIDNQDLEKEYVEVDAYVVESGKLASDVVKLTIPMQKQTVIPPVVTPPKEEEVTPVKPTTPSEETPKSNEKPLTITKATNQIALKDTTDESLKVDTIQSNKKGLPQMSDNQVNSLWSGVLGMGIIFSTYSWISRRNKTKK